MVRAPARRYLLQWAPSTQPDPIGLAGGLNLYGYAGGDPINFSDPFGLSKCPPACGEVFEQLRDLAPAMERELATFVPKNAAMALAGNVVGSLVGRAVAAFRGAAAAESAEVSASTPIGSRRAPMHVPRGTNSPADIGGRTYTGHALDQMQGRGVMPSMVEETIRTGVRTAGREGATVYQLPAMRIVVNPSGSIKTVIPQTP